MAMVTRMGQRLARGRTLFWQVITQPILTLMALPILKNPIYTAPTLYWTIQMAMVTRMARKFMGKRIRWMQLITLSSLLAVVRAVTRAAISSRNLMNRRIMDFWRFGYSPQITHLVMSRLQGPTLKIGTAVSMKSPCHRASTS